MLECTKNVYFNSEIKKYEILEEFLQENRAEVKMLSILEYDKEGMEIGKNKGMELAELRIIQNMQNRGYSINKIAEAIGKTEDEINNILNGQD